MHSGIRHTVFYTHLFSLSREIRSVFSSGNRAWCYYWTLNDGGVGSALNAECRQRESARSFLLRGIYPESLENQNMWRKSVQEVSSSSKHFWSFTVKKNRSILLNSACLKGKTVSTQAQRSDFDFKKTYLHPRGAVQACAPYSGTLLA